MLFTIPVSHLQAHGGRRFEVVVVDNQLAAQGYISTGADDQGGIVRPYYNALHDHWANSPSPETESASADLPGFDVFSSSESFVGNGAAEALQGGDLTLTLLGAKKWVSPPLPPAGVPELEGLAVEEVIYVGNNSGFVDTQSLGSLTLATSIGAGGATDLDLQFDIDAEPAGVIYALRWVLSTTVEGITDSQSIYTLISPDGANPMEKLHHPALHLEKHLSTPLTAGDYTRDGAVDADDFAMWNASYGAAGAHLLADGNGDQTVDSVDYAIWREALPPGSGGAATPEPSAAVLAGMLALATGVCGSRSRSCRYRTAGRRASIGS